MLAGAKIRSLSGKVEECGSDTKKLYNLMNITGRFNVNPTPPGYDKVIAKDMADYFLSKIEKIRDDLVTCCIYSPSPRDTAKLKVFQPMTEKEVIIIIRSMPTKSCESNVIPNNVLKQLLSDLGDVITSIVSLSLSTGIFSSD